MKIITFLFSSSLAMSMDLTQTLHERPVILKLPSIKDIERILKEGIGKIEDPDEEFFATKPTFSIGEMKVRINSISMVTPWIPTYEDRIYPTLGATLKIISKDEIKINPLDSMAIYRVGLVCPKLSLILPKPFTNYVFVSDNPKFPLPFRKRKPHSVKLAGNHKFTISVACRLKTLLELSLDVLIQQYKGGKLFPEELNKLPQDLKDSLPSDIKENLNKSLEQ